MSEWQPIETAPRDGTIIDLWLPDRTLINGYIDVAHRVAHCRWGNMDEWEAKFVEASSFTSLNSFGGDSPTHWMPLPAPPTA